MGRAVRLSAVWVGMAIAATVAPGQVPAQQNPPVQTGTTAVAPQSPAPPASPQSGPEVAGGKLHGTVKSGNVPLPGVTVTAQNTLTGKRFTTTTDITGAWSMAIPQNGRYVIRTQFAAFAQGSQEAVLNATSRDQTVNFELMLASRAAEQVGSRKARGRRCSRRSGNWRGMGCRPSAS
jgi:trimeric autotransporter adhesin